MATNASLCGICDLRNLSNPSTDWCPECEESLCSNCKEHHSLSKATRGHVTIDVADYQKLPPFIADIKQYCTDHNEKFLNFCHTHECPICYKCFQTHAGCRNVVPLENVTENSKKSHVFHDLTQDLSDLATNIKRIRKDREDNMTNIANQKKKYMDEVRQFREKINQHLDEIEQQLMKDLSDAETKCNQQIKALLDRLDKMEGEITDCQNIMQNMKQYASDLQTFLALTDIESKVVEKEKYLQSLVDDHKLDESTISCTTDSKLHEILSNTKAFGSVDTKTNPSSINLINRKAKQAQIMLNKTESIDDATPKKIKTISINVTKLTGCTMLPNGKMLFSTYGDFQERLIVTNTTGNFDFEMKLTSAFDVIVIDDSTVCVSSGYTMAGPGLHIIDIQSRKEIRFVESDVSCYGMTYVNGTLVYCGHRPNDVRTGIYELKGYKTCNPIKLPLNSWAYVAVWNGNYYYTKDNTNTVTCCNSKGQTIWEFKDANILRSPRGISVDNNGNLYVAGFISHNVVFIWHDGSQAKQILTKADGLINPNALFYDSAKYRLLVANYNDTAYLFEVL